MTSRSDRRRRRAESGARSVNRMRACNGRCNCYCCTLRCCSPPTAVGRCCIPAVHDAGCGGGCCGLSPPGLLCLPWEAAAAAAAATTTPGASPAAAASRTPCLVDSRCCGLQPPPPRTHAQCRCCSAGRETTAGSAAHPAACLAPPAASRCGGGPQQQQRLGRQKGTGGDRGLLLALAHRVWPAAASVLLLRFYVSG